jgi:hypothetical protein
MKHRSIPQLVLIVPFLFGLTCAAETWRDDFAGVDNLRTTDNITRVREFPRIVTRPDVRINRLDPSEYKDSAKNMVIGFGWFPAIIRLHDGQLLCFHREGREHGMQNYEARAVLRRSTDGGRTWQPVEIIMQEKDWAISPMFPTQTTDGAVWLNIRKLKIRGEGRGWKMLVVRSTDLGHTWTQVSDEYGMGTGPSLSNGKVIFTNWGSTNEWDTTRHTYLSEFVDGKIKWGPKRVHEELGISSDEWTMTETTTPGHLVAMMRQQHDTLYYATAHSLDYGRTWTNWRDSNVYMGNIPCRPRMHTMPDGRLIFTYGQRDIGRTFVVVSKDKGQTWDVDHRQVILHSPQEYHLFWDSHYTDIARAEGDKWLAVDYIASPKQRDLRGIYGTFIDARYFDDVYHGLTLKQMGMPTTGKAVGWWRFDEADGAFARDSQHAHFGEIHGAKRVRGRFGGALQFDGKDDYVMVYDEVTLWAEPYFAVEAWFNTRDPGKDQVIVSKGSRYKVLLKDGKPSLDLGGARSTATLAKPLEANRWYHLIVAHSRRGDYGRTTFFLDGKEVSHMRPAAINGKAWPQGFEAMAKQSDIKITGGPMFQPWAVKNSSQQNLTIGLDNDLKGLPFDGMIDEVVVYGKQLRQWDAGDRVRRYYLPSGVITSRPITGKNWKTFSANISAPKGTAVRFAILDTAGTTLLDNVKPGADISKLTADRIVLHAQLTTTVDGQSPILRDWSVTADQPTITTAAFPQQAALPQPKIEKKQQTIKIDTEAQLIAPHNTQQLKLYQVPIGTTKSMSFNLKVDPSKIEKAWLVMVVDDIDEPREATIVLNGKHPITINQSVLGEGEDHRGASVVPVDALVQGINTFKFTFADNLGGTTEGYTIMKAHLAVLTKDDYEIPL